MFKTTKELLWKSNLQIDSWVRNQRREDREIKKKKNGSREEVEDFHQVHRKISGGVGVICREQGGWRSRWKDGGAERQ